MIAPPDEGDRTMRKRLTLSTLALVTAVAATAAPTLPGTDGKDRAYEQFEIKNGRTVMLTVTNVTTNASSGNTAGITLYINGKQVHQNVVDRAAYSFSYTIASDGVHEAEAACSNTNADAYSCRITLEAVGKPPKIFD
jgi:FtsP/CotA-like multicopper oxidase with cupredoxin domain